MSESEPTEIDTSTSTGTDSSSPQTAPTANTDHPAVGIERITVMTVSDRSIYTFRERTGDTNPIHYDDDAAEDSLFGERIAPGMLVADVISPTLEDFPGLVLIEEQDIEYTAPTYPDDDVEAVGEIEAIETISEEKNIYRATIDVEVTALNDGEHDRRTVIESENVVNISGVENWAHERERERQRSG